MDYKSYVDEGWQSYKNSGCATCPRCGALVDLGYLSGHTQWHAEIRKVVTN